jgi:hypothetical protein
MTVFTLDVHAPIVSARASGTGQAPLKLYTGDFAGVTFYCGDQDLARDLAVAINGVLMAHRNRATVPTRIIAPAPTLVEGGARG